MVQVEGDVQAYVSIFASQIPLQNLHFAEREPALDGDGDGEAGGVFNFWFEANDPDSRTIYRRQGSGGNSGDGSDQRTLRRISNVALANATSETRDIVRIVGNGGADGDINTLGRQLGL